MGKVVNQTELAEIIGKTDVTIWEWQRQGLPIQKQGQGRLGNEYDTAAVIEWLIGQALTRAGRRKDVLQEELLELELKEKRAKDALRENTLVPVDQVRPVWERRVLTAAAFMQARHSRLAALLETTPGIEGKRDLLKQEDAEFLKKLGVEGERMQSELENFLNMIPVVDVETFLQRICGNGEARI